MSEGSEKGSETCNRCPRCGAAFVCGMQAGQASCWCAELPVLQKAAEGVEGCYCPDCLRQLLESQQA